MIAADAVRGRHAGRHRGADGRREGPRRRGRAVHGGLRADGPSPRRVRGIRIQERDPADGDRPHRAPAADGPDQAGRALPREARRGRLPRRLRVQGHPRQRRAAQDARRPRRPPAGQGHRLDPSPRRARALRRVAHARAVRLATVPTFHFDLGELPPETRVLREEVRDFLRAELGDRAPARRAHSWGGFDREFSRKVGDRGWIGMTWPERYGGHERSSLERYVVLEEMLAAGAPVSAHWVADRQSGPLLLRFGTEAQPARVPPTTALAGSNHFNMVVFEDVFLPEEMRVGEEGAGWRQVTTELALERSGPERYLSSLALLVELIREAGKEPGERPAAVVGRLVAHLVTLRQMSLSVAGMLQAGDNPNLEAAVVKDVGTTFEQEIPEVVHALLGVEPTLASGTDLQQTLGDLVQRAPSFSLRGGTREILRGIIARGLGLR